ncbi:MAG: endonuclease/exonuclease/phosphatase family protein [Chloroflexota bacterium]
MTHWTIQMTVVIVVLLIVGGIVRVHLSWLLCGGVALVVNLVILYPFFLPRAADLPDTVETLRVMTFNVSTRSDHYERITDYIVEVDPDVVLMVEVREDLLAHLDEIVADAYPHRLAVPSPWTMGKVFLSKTPFTRTDVIPLPSKLGGKTYLDVSIVSDGKALRLISVHPFPPTAGRRAQSRNTELQMFATVAATSEEPVVLLGDFNASPWSAPMKDLQRSTELRPAAYGHGIRPTWQYLWVLWAPLDYAMVSDQISVDAYWTGPWLGSDHTPVLLDLWLTQ